jgi:hypothetical protein
MRNGHFLLGCSISYFAVLKHLELLSNYRISDGTTGVFCLVLSQILSVGALVITPSQSDVWNDGAPAFALWLLSKHALTKLVA